MGRTCVAVGLVILSGVLAGAQAGAPPVDLSGMWRLDTYLSDRPEQVDASIRANFEFAGDTVPAGAAFGRGERGRERPAGDRNQPRDRGNTRDQKRDEDVQQLLDLTAMVRLPATTLTVTEDASMVTFTDAAGQSHTFHTNGSREKQTVGTATLETSARWEGPQLVVDVDLTKGRRMTLTYSIVPASKQLLLRVAFERAPRDLAPFEVKHVYDRRTE
jgi:hypothetical protein